MEKSEEKALKNILNQLKEMLKFLNTGYSKANLDEALDKRNSYLGQLTYLSAHIEEIYYRDKAKVFDENPKMAIGKIEIKLEITEIGRLYRIKNQIYETIVHQCRNISSMMIEIQSERKHNDR